MMRSRLVLGLLAVLAACSDESPATGDESSSSSTGGEETSTASSVGTTLTTSATLDTTADTTTAADTSTGASSSSEDGTSEASTSEGGVCGNDVAEPGEACDGDDLDGQDCASQGFIAGALACSAGCTFDYAACSNCGDGNQGGTEVCDGSDVADATCLSEGFQGGALGCAADCNAFDTSTCSNDPSCDEEDIGSALGQHLSIGTTVGEDNDLDQMCANGGSVDRVIRWVAPADGTYRFDTVGSNYDTALAIYENCVSWEIACNDDVGNGVYASRIVLDVEAGDTLLIAVNGYQGSVGDYVLNVNLDEAGGPCCQPHGSYGCDGGTCETDVCALDADCCNAAAAWDQDCVALAVDNCAACANICGNGVIDDVAEECDFFDLQGQSCGSLGYDYGTLLCADDCTLDASDCGDYDGDCCSDNGADSPGCEDLGCTTAICNAMPECCTDTWDAACATAAATDCAACNPDVCGNNLIDGMGESCDGIDLAGEDCASQGYAFGELACADDCTFGLGSCNDVGACIEENLGSATGNGVASGSTDGEDEDLAQNCGDNGAVDHVLTWTAPSAGTWRFDAVDSAYDTVLSLHADCDSAAFACNDDGFPGNLDSRIVVDLAAGEVVVIAVAGYSGSTGSWVLNVNLDVPGTGDCCVAHGTYGCDSEAGCEATVCATNADCCDTDAAWSQDCVEIAATSCASCM